MADQDTTKRLENILAMSRALLASMDHVISTVPDSGSTWHFSSFRDYAQHYNRLAQAAEEAEPSISPLLVLYDAAKSPNFANTLGMQQHSLFQNVHGNMSMLCALISSNLGSSSSSVDARELEDFLSSSLRRAMLSGEPKDEAEVQDTIEKLLVGRGMAKGIDYDRETGRVKHSGKESIPDFIFRPSSTALEVKFTKSKQSRSRIVDEMNADIAAYGKVYEHIISLVYDIASITDVEEFKRDIESVQDVSVLVVKH